MLEVVVVMMMVAVEVAVFAMTVAVSAPISEAAVSTLPPISEAQRPAGSPMSCIGVGGQPHHCRLYVGATLIDTSMNC